MTIHWLIIFKNSWLSEKPTKAEAVEYCRERFNLPPKSVKKLTNSSIVRIPRKGLLEINCCECTNGLHEEELTGVD